jgi:hypothetical protein
MPRESITLATRAGERYGAITTALDSSIHTPVMAMAGGMSSEHGRWAFGRRSRLGRMLQARIPSLIHSPGVASIDGIPVAAAVYDENKPLRDQPAVSNTVAGAMAIQNAFEMHEAKRGLSITFTSTICDHIHRHEGAAGVRRILGVLALAKKHGPAVIEDAAKAAVDLGLPTYRFLRRYLERRPPVPLTLRQVDPLIRQLTLYRDLIDRTTGDPS